MAFRGRKKTARRSARNLALSIGSLAAAIMLAAAPCLTLNAFATEDPPLAVTEFPDGPISFPTENAPPIPTPEPTPVPTPEPTPVPTAAPTPPPSGGNNTGGGNTGGNGGGVLYPPSNTTTATPTPTPTPEPSAEPTEKPTPAPASSEKPAGTVRPAGSTPTPESTAEPNYVTFAKVDMKNNTLAGALFIGGLICAIIGAVGIILLIYFILRSRKKKDKKMVVDISKSPQPHRISSTPELVTSPPDRVRPRTARREPDEADKMYDQLSSQALRRAAARDAAVAVSPAVTEDDDKEDIMQSTGRAAVYYPPRPAEPRPSEAPRAHQPPAGDGRDIYSDTHSHPRTPQPPAGAILPKASSMYTEEFSIEEQKAPETPAQKPLASRLRRTSHSEENGEKPAETAPSSAETAKPSTEKTDEKPAPVVTAPVEKEPVKTEPVKTETVRPKDMDATRQIDKVEKPAARHMRKRSSAPVTAPVTEDEPTREFDPSAIKEKANKPKKAVKSTPVEIKIRPAKQEEPDPEEMGQLSFDTAEIPKEEKKPEKEKAPEDQLPGQISF